MGLIHRLAELRESEERGDPLHRDRGGRGRDEGARPRVRRAGRRRARRGGCAVRRADPARAQPAARAGRRLEGLRRVVRAAAAPLRLRRGRHGRGDVPRREAPRLAHHRRRRARRSSRRRERIPSADELIVEWPQEALAQVQPDHQTAIVVLTHDDKFDEPALIGALETEAFYIGALGSRRNQERRRERLLEAGVEESALDRIMGPCGLDVGADTQEETALSILAEILAVRGAARGRVPEEREEAHPRRGRVAVPRVVWLSVAPVKSMRLGSVGRDRARGERRPGRPALLPRRRRRRRSSTRSACRALLTRAAGRRRRAPAASLPGRLGRRGDVDARGARRDELLRPARSRAASSTGRGRGAVATRGQAAARRADEREGDGIDRGAEAGASLVSTGVARGAASRAGVDGPVDGRRFRMTIGVDGVEPHAEDGWIGERVRVGGAVVARARATSAAAP